MSVDVQKKACTIETVPRVKPYTATYRFSGRMGKEVPAMKTDVVAGAVFWGEGGYLILSNDHVAISRKSLRLILI